MPVAAGAILNVGVLALAAAFDHTAQSGSTAVFDSLHQPLLLPRQIVRLPVSGAMESKDVGQLHGWRWHALALGFGFRTGRRGVPQPLERTAHPAYGTARKSFITRGGVS